MLQQLLPLAFEMLCIAACRIIVLPLKRTRLLRSRRWLQGLLGCAPRCFRAPRVLVLFQLLPDMIIPAQLLLLLLLRVCVFLMHAVVLSQQQQKPSIFLCAAVL